MPTSLHVYFICTNRYQMPRRCMKYIPGILYVRVGSTNVFVTLESLGTFIAIFFFGKKQCVLNRIKHLFLFFIIRQKFQLILSAN